MMRRHSLPAEVYALVDATPGAVLLEGTSVEGAGIDSTGIDGTGLAGTGECSGFSTRLFVAPSRILVAHQPDEIPALFRAIESAVAAGQYAAGFFAYECGQAFEPKAHMRTGKGELAPTELSWFGIYDRAYVFDHATGQFLGGDPPGLQADLAALRPEISASDRAENSAPIPSDFALTESGYGRRIAQIHEWIRAGDIYQLNFTAPLHIATSLSAAALYARLRTRQPAAYGAFLHLQSGRRILSFSPELFFHLESGAATRRIVTRPMKGTAPRGRNTQEDRERAAWLSADAKNRSENLMIVDLLRNDLGRIARFGTVRVDNLFAVERHPTLWQMTSTVSAELRADVGFEQIFRALFPSGSVTGAPKVRAMQLIAQLEDAPRGVYTGAIGSFSRRQTIFNVAIRTLELETNSLAPDAHALRGRMGIGSGIVIDSEPGQEFRECLLKAEFLTRVPVHFSLIETILWNQGFPLLGLHFERLADSAAYFDYPCNVDPIRAALQSFAHLWTDSTPRKVRLLLNRDGTFTLTAEAIASAPDPSHPARVRVSRMRTDPADPFLFHKTTHRTLYAQEFAAAASAGFDDILFFNVRGELTEGAISNVILEIGGRWFTPPIACGLLAGIYRRHLLESGASETHPVLEERVLTGEDLRRADAIYICNAVRALRRATIDWAEPK
jgi:para-aminobenzoate synthetase/4-amino-4-deoxychorismate lyase